MGLRLSVFKKMTILGWNVFSNVFIYNYYIYIYIPIYQYITKIRGWDVLKKMENVSLNVFINIVFIKKKMCSATHKSFQWVAFLDIQTSLSVDVKNKWTIDDLHWRIYYDDWRCDQHRQHYCHCHQLLQSTLFDCS